MELLGEFDCVVEANEIQVYATFLVVKGRATPLLSCRTAEDLNMIRFNQDSLRCNIMSTQDTQNYNGSSISINPKLFEGLGKLKGYQINIPINKNFPPVAQPLRKIPIHLQNKVDKCIKEYLELDVIEKVTGPTPWVNPVVPVEKKDGSLRLCMDMRRANEAITRERYPMKTVEELS